MKFDGIYCRECNSKFGSDADIVAMQYQIDVKKVAKDLKEFHEYDGENINIVFDQIKKIAYEKIRKKSYERNYLEMIDEKYSKANFITFLHEVDIKENIRFYSEFQYYTCYEEDIINIERYKLRLYLEGQQYLYPDLLVGVMAINPSIFKNYGYFKFHMLMRHLKDG